MKLGKVKENIALEKYTELTSETVEKIGFVVLSTFSWLGASPGGFVIVETVIEVKTVVSETKINIETAASRFITKNSINVSEKGDWYHHFAFKLREKSKYYAQMLLFMDNDMPVS